MSMLLTDITLKNFGTVLTHSSGVRVVPDRDALFTLFKGMSFVGACEIGVREGWFSKVVLQHLACKKLYMVDPWLKQGVDAYPEDAPTQAIYDDQYRGAVAGVDMQIKEGRAVVLRKFSSAAMPLLKNAIDWVYIDANHTYECCKEDLKLSADAIREGGFICGHDLLTLTKHPHYGVLTAVAEFCAETQWRLWGYVQDGYPSYVLKKENNATETGRRIEPPQKSAFVPKGYT